MWHDLRLAARLLAAHRSFTAAAVTALAVGIAGTTTMFTLLHGVYLRDLPFSHPDRIVSIGVRYLDGRPGAIDNLSLPDLRDLQASARLFDGIVAADEDSMDLAGDGHAAERFVGAWVSHETFALLGHRPALGRGFNPGDDRPGAEPVVILGGAVWKRRYGSDPAIVGARIRVNGVLSTVVGVMPDGFGFPHQSGLWQPLAARGGEGGEDRGARNLDVFGRMAAGVTREQAEADAGRVMARLAREFPETNAGAGAVVRPFRDLTTGGPIRIVFTALAGAVVFLLLIACANVGNVLLARGASRAREIAVRVALGASRWQVVRQLLAESVLLALLAGAAGLGLAALGVGAFERSARGTGAPYWVQAPFEGAVFAFAAAVCLGTAVLCGLAPALQTSRVGVAGALGDGGRGAAGSLRASRWSDGFVVAQLALSLTLLAGAGFWMRNVQVLFSRFDVGVETSGLVAAELSLPPRRYPDEESRRSFFRRLGEQLEALPDMRAGITSAAPARGAPRRGVSIDGRTPAGAPVVSTVAVGPGYLEALDLSPVQGRFFTPADEDPAARVAVVNEAFAALYVPGRDAVGRTVRLDPAAPGAPAGEPLTIAGVVANVRQTAVRQESVGGSTPDAVVYIPYAAAPPPFATVIVRGGRGAGPVAGALRAALGQVDPDVPLTSVVPLDEAIRQELGILALFGSMFGLFAATALGLASVGLYAVTAHAAARRTRELGVRLALGARARHVWWVVTRRAAIQVGVGLVLGTAGALGVGQLLRGGLTAVSSRDPVTLVGVPLLMVAVALVACALPAVRATRLDAAVALRAE